LEPHQLKNWNLFVATQKRLKVAVVGASSIYWKFQLPGKEKMHQEVLNGLKLPEKRLCWLSPHVHMGLWRKRKPPPYQQTFQSYQQKCGFPTYLYL